MNITALAIVEYRMESELLQDIYLMFAILSGLSRKVFRVFASLVFCMSVAHQVFQLPLRLKMFNSENGSILNEELACILQMLAALALA